MTLVVACGIYPEGSKIMRNTRELVRSAYIEHFKFLRELGSRVDRLEKDIAAMEDESAKSLLASHLNDLKRDLIRAAENLDIRGTELYRNAA